MHISREEFLRERICQLRINKNISEYQLSLELGPHRVIFSQSHRAEFFHL